MKISRVERVELCHRSRNGQIDSGRSRNLFDDPQRIYVGDLSHRYDAGTARGQGGRCEAGCRIARQNAVIYYFAAIQGVREALKEAPEFLMNGSEQPLLLTTFERFGGGAKLRTENVDS